jgi:mannan endo-1,4-beta-mannosidase
VWSGGFAQYVSWVTGEELPNPFTYQYDWNDFIDFSARFYTNEQANAAYQAYIKMLLNRTNTITGVTYKDDPTIMAWQLANEPRPGRGEPKKENMPAFKQWVRETADFIKSVDPNYLVTTSNEGTGGCIWDVKCYKDIHRYENIDYMTAHLWILNWKWYDPGQPGKTFPEAKRKAIKYIDEHIRYASELGKPLVLEEFGIPRDRHSYSPESTTRYRDQYFELIFAHIYQNAKQDGPLVGSNFWAWGGYGTARDPENPIWKPGDPFTGDPPQEPQGRNSIFATDSSTIDILETYAKKMQAL